MIKTSKAPNEATCSAYTQAILYKVESFLFNQNYITGGDVNSMFD